MKAPIPWFGRGWRATDETVACWLGPARATQASAGEMFFW